MRTSSRLARRMTGAPGRARSPRLAAALAAVPAMMVLSFAGDARADGTPSAVLPANSVGGLASGGDRWQGSLGVRTSLLRDAGFDPFSTSDALAQVTFAVTHALRAGPGLVPALGLALDIGGADAVARGADAQLGLVKLALVLEPRFVPRPGFYVAARLVPGLMHAEATLRDASAPAMLTTSYWTASIDTSLAAGVRINGWTTPIGLWLLGEGGYGWAPRHDLTLSPALPSSDAQKAGATSLGTFAARGPFMRVSLALSY
jgi:hypothetical protein